MSGRTFYIYAYYPQLDEVIEDTVETTNSKSAQRDAELLFPLAQLWVHHEKAENPRELFKKTG